MIFNLINVDVRIPYVSQKEQDNILIIRIFIFSAATHLFIKTYMCLVRIGGIANDLVLMILNNTT